MEFSASFNGILILLFLVLAFIKSAKDAKKKGQSSNESKPNLGEELKDIFREIMEGHKGDTPPMSPPVPPSKRTTQMSPPSFSAEQMGKEFVSSLSLVTDFEKESSLKGYYTAERMKRMVTDRTAEKEPHPLLDDLMGENREEEFRKAIIYSEILARKY